MYIVFSVEDDDLQSNGDDGFEGELWLARSDGSISVVSCNQYGWLDYKVPFFDDKF